MNFFLKKNINLKSGIHHTTKMSTWNEFRKESLSRKPADMKYNDFVKQLSAEWKMKKLTNKLGGTSFPQLNKEFVINQPPILKTNCRDLINESDLKPPEEIVGQGIKPKRARRKKDETLNVIKESS